MPHRNRPVLMVITYPNISHHKVSVAVRSNRLTANQECVCRPERQKHADVSDDATLTL